MKFWLLNLVTKVMLSVTFLESALRLSKQPMSLFFLVSDKEGKTKIIRSGSKNTAINFHIKKKKVGPKSSQVTAFPLDATPPSPPSLQSSLPSPFFLVYICPLSYLPTRAQHTSYDGARGAEAMEEVTLLFWLFLDTRSREWR